MKAIIKKSGLEVFVRTDVKANNSWNHGKICVSKQPTGMMYFCVDSDEIEIKNN